MACDLTTGRARKCKETLGGNATLFLYNYIKDPFTVVGGECTAINEGLTEVFEYPLEGDLNTLIESMVNDRNTGTNVNTQTLTISLKAIDAATGAEMTLLAKSYSMAVIKDRNGIYHAVGIDDGIDFTIEQNTGGVKSDFNGYTLTGLSTTGSLSPKLDSTTATAFEALV